MYKGETSYDKRHRKGCDGILARKCSWFWKVVSLREK